MAIDKNIFFEQYKLYVGTAEKVSEKRQTANNYFLSLNSFLLVLSGYLTTIKFHLIMKFLFTLRGRISRKSGL